MPEESTFRKYACPKLKLSRKLWDLNASKLSLVNYVKVTNRKTFQHKIFPELNSKKHTPSPIPFDFYEIAELRKTIVAELRKTWVSKKRNRAILREMTWMIAQIVVFFAQNWCAKKEKFCVSFCKNCAKVLRMETLNLIKNVEIPSIF